jgi:transcriptional antiterminator NusG
MGWSGRKFKLSYQEVGSVSLGRPFGLLPCRNDRIELAGARQAQAVQKTDGRMRKHHQVREGQIVRVIDGPFTGFRGEVKEADEQTVKVAVQVFGRVTPVDLALGQIESVKKNQTEALPKTDR